MEETYIELSENGWEYTGNITIKSNGVPKRVNETTIEVDGVTIAFDEDIRIVCTN